jgi:hypothetical protein
MKAGPFEVDAKAYSVIPASDLKKKESPKENGE